MTKRGEIYYVEWPPGRGSEQMGFRPALIVQNDVGNQSSPTTIVVAISTRRRRPYPFHVHISAQESKLPQDSVVKCEQIQTIGQSRLGHMAGSLSAERMREVDQALRISLGLEQ